MKTRNERKEIKKVNAVLICDDNYIIPTLTTIMSIKTSKKSDVFCKIYVIANTTNCEKYEIFEALNSELFQVEMVIVNEERVNDLAYAMKDSFCVASPSALMKFFIPDLIEDAEKILYLDGDIIVRRDLYELYSIDVSDVYGAVVVDSSKLYSGRAIVHELPNYFNSGVMLLNTKRMKNVINDLIETKMNQEDKSLMDQDVFNNVIGDEIKTISIKYNFLYTNLNRARNKYCMSDLNCLYGTNYLNLRSVYEDAVILHFSSKDKPWKCIESPMARLWYKAYREMKKEVLTYGKGIDIIFDFEKKINDDPALKNAICENTIDYDSKLIVSLTSFPARVNYIHDTIVSILEQSEIPDRILLWLSYEEFENREDDLPMDLLELEKEGLEIKWCENIRSHKKYMYTMKENPKDIVIIVDDDTIYEQQTISYLYKSYLRFPECVSANRVHIIGFDDNKNISPYMEWKQGIENMFQIPSYALFPTGVGGVLYPPKSLFGEVLNIKEAEEVCPTTDDVWLKFMAVLNNTKTVCAYPNIELNLVEETQKTALYRINRRGGENDRQLSAAVKYCSSFDKEFIDKIYEDYKEAVCISNNPAISVIIPINDSECNMRNINTIFKQSLKNVEYIILDNGSKGNVGRKLVDDERVTYLSNKNWSIGTEIDEALKMARGEYVIIAEMDTEYHYNFLKKNYICAKNGNADICVFKIDYFDDVNNKAISSEWEKKYFRIPASCNFNFDNFEHDRFGTFTYRVTDKMFKREFLICNGIRVNKDGNGYGDFKFIYEAIIKAKKMVYESEVLAFKMYLSKLKHSSINKWDFVMNSLSDMRNYLIQEGEWGDAIEQDFANFALDVILHEYNLVTTKELEEKYKLIQEREISEFIKLDKGAEYYYDHEAYLKIQYIKNTDYMWIIARDCIGCKSFEVTQSKQLREYGQKISRKNDVINNRQRKIEQLEARVKELEVAEYSLSEIRKSKSYKLGLLLTAIPRKIRGTKSK